MLTVVICENFGWTYEQFLDQPQNFIDLIREKMKIDGQKAENEIKNLKKK